MDNARATIGDNNPPDPIDEITAPYDDKRANAEIWLDGKAVETEGEMKAVDEARSDMRAWRIGLEAGQKEAASPLYKVYKAELERWKPTIEDAQRIEAGLVAIVDVFKRKLAAEKEAARKAAESEAWAKTRAAEEAARNADASNIAATRAAADAMAEAEAAQRAAMAAQKDTVKGLRTVTKYVTLDPVLLARWLWTNDRAAQDEFHNDRAKKLGLHLPGVFEQHKSKEAF